MATVFLSAQIERLLQKMDVSRLGKNVAIKVHFGEQSCDTYVDPKIVKAVYDKIVSTGRKAALVECNVLYKGARTTASSHIKVAHDHGFTFAPIDILDGEKGDECIKIGERPAKLGAGLAKYDSMVVITHFKGHMIGYGGALKNVGMGLGSRAGKLDMHCSVKPSVNSKCIGCGVCVKNCDVKAIDILQGKAKIDPEKCVGCAMCIAVCPQAAVQIPWGSSSPQVVQQNIVDYAAAVMKVIPRSKMVFINVLQKITSECDCMNKKQKPIMADVGIALSDDIVAIDRTSLDLAIKNSNGAFEKMNSADKDFPTRYAAKLGLGEEKYSIRDLDG